MRKLALFLTAFVVLSASTVSTAFAAEDGKSVFLKYSCNTCHKVSSAGIDQKNPKSKAPDLTDVTVRHDKDGGKEFVRKHIRLEQVHVSCPQVEKARDDKNHLGGKFKGNKEEEDALVDWLDQQRSKK